MLGQVYYDLIEDAEKRALTDVAIMRVEQLYPFRRIQLTAELKRYATAKDVVWCQEEPKNQGAWTFIAPMIEGVMEQLGRKMPLRYTGRKASASPAVGQMSLHQAELKAFLNDALTL